MGSSVRMLIFPLVILAQSFHLGIEVEKTGSELLAKATMLRNFLDFISYVRLSVPGTIRGIKSGAWEFTIKFEGRAVRCVVRRGEKERNGIMILSYSERSSRAKFLPSVSKMIDFGDSVELVLNGGEEDSSFNMRIRRKQRT